MVGADSFAVGIGRRIKSLRLSRLASRCVLPLDVYLYAFADLENTDDGKINQKDPG